MNEQQIPVEPYVQALKDQRSQALDQAAEWHALAMGFKAERDQLAAELEQLRSTDAA
jgi:hypothetical protein